MLSSAPYPGLRPYKREESSIFFGREELCNELLDKLAVTRFLPIVGPSGCGKSSLVIAGMLADIRIGFMPGTKDNWKIAEMRPGDQPFKNLADALRKKSALGPKNNISSDRLRSGLSEFIDMMEEIGFPEDTNLLLLVDQFEEIFRYHAGNNSNEADVIESSRDEANAFVSLLLALSEQQVLPIYVIITMRTDFIGDCAKFNGLPEAINRGQFLVPRLTKLQLQRAIVEPVRVFDCEVEDALMSRLLNDIGTDPDDLPLMQHVLLRIYNQIKDKKLTYQGYLDVGGFESALSEHANEAYNQLTEEQKPIAEKLFRCLTKREKDHGRDTRCPTKLVEIADVCIKKPEKDEEKKKTQLKEMLEQLTEVVDVFRQPTFSFITPSVSKEKKLKPDTILDISHESLIRQWKPNMEDWIKAEAKSASDYFQLEKNATRWKKEGKSKEWLEPMPQLQISLDWKERENPTPAWAERYKFSEREEKDFNLAMDFLEESETEFERKKIAEKKEHAKTTRNKLIFVIILILVLVSAPFAILKLKTYQQYKFVESGNTAIKKTNYKEAVKKYSKAIYWNSDNPNTYLSLGNALTYLEKYDEAIENFKKGIRIAPEYPELRKSFGYAYFKKDDYSNAIESFKKAIELAPEKVNDNVYNYNTVGYELIKQRKPVKAIKYYKKAIEIDPQNIEAYLIVGQILLEQGEEYEAEAIKYYKKAIEKAHNNVDANVYTTVGNALLKQSKESEAIYYYKETIKIEPNNLYVNISLGDAYYKQKMEDKAIEHYKKAIDMAIDMVNIETYKNVSKILNKQGKEDEADKYNKIANEIEHKKESRIAEYEKRISEVDFDNYRDYITKGKALLNQGKEDEAIIYYKNAIDLAPDKINVNVYTTVGYALLKQDKEDKAIEYFKKAIDLALAKIDVNACRIVGNALLKHDEKEKEDEAIIYYKKVLDFLNKYPDQNKEDIDAFQADIEARLRNQKKKNTQNIRIFLGKIGFDL